VVALTVVSLIAYYSGWQVPLWFSPRNFGPFPNRNQMGNLLALTGIMIEALALRDLRERRSGRVAAWAVALAIIGTGLVVAYSRAGIGMFFAGSVLWLLFVIRGARQRHTGAVAFAAMVVMASSFLLFGGDTLGRFTDAGDALTSDSRWTILRDSTATAAEAPLLGHGLGNFEPVFAMKRAFWKKDDHLLHPESDWLWATIEWGIPATVLLLALAGLALAGAFPMAAGEDRSLRFAAFVGCVLFLLHGLVDVSGHRPGTLWPALLLLAAARRPAATGGPLPRWLPPAFRAAGVILIVISACWLASYQGLRLLPTTATAWQLNAQIEKAAAAGEHAAVVQLATESLAIRPLDYWTYLRRGRARLLGSEDRAGAEKDFRAARTLEPAYSGPYMDEGDAWLDARVPDRAVAAYREAFRRVPARAPDLYRALLAWIPAGIDGRDVVRELGHTDPKLWLLFLQTADVQEAREEVTRALAEDPALSKFTLEEQPIILDAWWRGGQREEVARYVSEHPALLPSSWRLLAAWHVDAKRFPEACELARKVLPKPSFPTPSTASRAELEKDLKRNRADVVAAYALASQQRAAGDRAAALETLQPVTQLAECPGYLLYMQAELRTEMQDWEKAWTAWVKVAERKR
jgi:tetratricopeptide (TPR) repeat protein